MSSRGGWGGVASCFVDELDLSMVLVFAFVLLSNLCACMYSHHFQQSMGQSGKIANPARGQLNREIK